MFKIFWLSLGSGLIGAVAWLLGDILLVGFDLDTADQVEKLAQTSIQNKALAVYMSKGSRSRLIAGALIANFTVFLLIASCYALLLATNQERLAWLAVALVFIGYTLSPVAHCAFYYVGIQGKYYLETLDTHGYSQVLERSINDANQFLWITWSISVGISGLGWLVYAWLIMIGKTAFPPYFAFFTPCITTFIFMGLHAKLKHRLSLLNGAALNEALSVFYLLIFAYFLMTK